jgi:hypothetical protein
MYLVPKRDTDQVCSEKNHCATAGGRKIPASSWDLRQIAYIFKQLQLFAPSQLFTFWRGEALEEIRNCHRRKTSQFTGIEERTCPARVSISFPRDLYGG